jgi:iron complex transport system ATP-binding protein
VRRETAILKDINWRVTEKEHWCILGANGSGKTTLLNVLLAYFNPSSGMIKVLGKEYGKNHWPSLRTQIGIVSNSINQMIRVPSSALEIVVSGKHALVNQPITMTQKIREHAMDILTRLGCEQLAARSWFKLSQGERQRVLIGRAMMADAELLILDEPCAGLDPVAREHFLQFIDTFAHTEHSPTLLFVTHHAEEIMPAFSKLLLLKAGRVFISGDKQTVLTSENLGQIYGCRVHLANSGTRFSINVVNQPETIM